MAKKKTAPSPARPLLREEPALAEPLQTPPALPPAMRLPPGAVELLDCPRLPGEVAYRSFTATSTVAQAIWDYTVIGPGVVSAAGVACVVMEARRCARANSAAAFDYSLQEAFMSLRSARPSCVMLANALAWLRSILAQGKQRRLPPEAIAAEMGAWAEGFYERIRACEQKIAALAYDIIAAHPRVLTTGASGSLSSIGSGTVLGSVFAAFARGVPARVICSASAAVHPGLRINVMEMRAMKIPYETITNSAAAYMLMRGQADALLLPAIRICANGDVIAPAGACQCAIAARHFGVPVYILTYGRTADDQCPTGLHAPLETEVRYEPVRQGDINLFVPVFEPVPANTVTAYVTEHGVFRPGADGEAGAFVRELTRLHAAPEQ
ncbi:MAG: hypothetical protein HUK26_01630 [Duodenibacillus sp.]|nr:hypothetical protein [Duodenibacillus sp.]